VYVGRPKEALQQIQRAIRLAPYPPGMYLRFEGLAYHSLQRYDEAIAAFKRATARNPKSPLPLVWLAITHADMGQMDEARAAAQEVLNVDPSFSAKGYANLLDYKDRTIPQHVLATLIQLGLPE
jgi:adenylate cyclase